MCWGSKERIQTGTLIPARVHKPQRQSPKPTSNPPPPVPNHPVSIPLVPVSVPPSPSPEVSTLRDSTTQALESPSSRTEQPFGLKVLAHGIDPVVDLVAVHGLDGHREETWTAENGALWLRDYLPESTPNVRILVYGYDGRTRGSTPLSCQTLHDHAISLITDLNLNRQGTNANERPIIFIAHSIGGIIVKDALIHSNSANKNNLEYHNAIKTSTYGILFFGTPHQGSGNLAWKRIFLNAASLFTNINSPILRDLEEGSGSLQKQLGQYTHISSDFDTKFFYETYPTSSGSSVIVPRGSAIVPGTTDTEVFAIYSDHQNLVKYKSTDDDGFRKVSLCLRSMVEKAPTKVLDNWQRWRRIKGDLDPYQKLVLCQDPASSMLRRAWNEHNPMFETQDWVLTKHIIVAASDGMQVTFEIPFESEYRRNQHFTGRQYLLDRLHNQISATKSTPVILYGTGGIGKTQIALEYVYTRRKDYDSIFWINAATEATTLMGFRAAAQRLIKQHAKIAYNAKPDYLMIGKVLDMIGVVDENGRISPAQEHSERMVQGVKQWLIKEENQNYLLVFDNVDDLDSFDIGDYIPSAPHGTIIMTSRRPECSDFGIGLEVTEMLESEGVTLLLKSARLEIDPTSPDFLIAVEITKLIGYLPLGIVQAGAYIAARKISLKKYLGTYEIYFNKVFSEKPPRAVWSYGDRTALTTWEISYQAIREENAEATELLSLCSFLSNDDIREDMLCRGKKLDENDTEFGNCLILLFSYSLAYRKESDDSFYIHPLVHTWARERLEEQARVQKAREAVILLGFVISYPGYRTSEHWDYEGMIMAHVDVVGSNIDKYLNTELTETLLVTGISWVAKVGSEWGWLKKAEKLQLRVVDARQRMLGKDHPHTLTAMAHLASTYWDEGEWKRAEELQAEVIEAKQKTLGNGDPETLTAMANLASSYRQQGRWNEAEKLELQAVEALQKVLGSEHPDTLTEMSNLASTYRNQGRWKEAEELQLQVMGGIQKALGKEHPHTITTMFNLATTYREQGRWKEAEELELQVLEATKKVLGNRHPYIAVAMGGLASTYSGQGRWEEAETLQLQVVETMQRDRGQDHPETLSAMGNLAFIYWKQGRMDQAEVLEVQVLEVTQKNLGPEHPDTLTSMANLASTYRGNGKLNEAEKLQLQAMEGMQRALGDDHPDTSRAIRILASTYSDQERWEEAETLQKKLLEVRLRTLGASDPQTVEARVSLARTYRQLGKNKEAEELDQ